GVRLGVEAVVLRQPAGEEDEDDRLGRMIRRSGGPQRGEVFDPKPEQADGPRLQGGAAGRNRVSEHGACGHQMSIAGRTRSRNRFAATRSGGLSSERSVPRRGETAKGFSAAPPGPAARAGRASSSRRRNRSSRSSPP